MIRTKTSAALAAVVLAAGGLLAACDKSAQSGDGATGKGEVGTAAYTPNGQVTQTGASDAAINAPAETVSPAASGEAAATPPAEGATALAK